VRAETNGNHISDLTMPNRIYINIAKVKGRNEFIRAQ